MVVKLVKEKNSEYSLAVNDPGLLFSVRALEEYV